MLLPGPGSANKTNSDLEEATFSHPYGYTGHYSFTYAIYITRFRPSGFKA